MCWSLFKNKLATLISAKPHIADRSLFHFIYCLWLQNTTKKGQRWEERKKKQQYRHKDTQIWRNTDLQTYRHTDRQTYRHTDIKTYRHNTSTLGSFSAVFFFFFVFFKIARQLWCADFSTPRASCKIHTFMFINSQYL